MNDQVINLFIVHTKVYQIKNQINALYINKRYTQKSIPHPSHLMNPRQPTQQSLGDDDQDEDDNEFERQQGEILRLLGKYKEKRKNNIYKDLTNAFFSYELLLESNYASPTKYNWLSGKKKETQNLKNEKALQNHNKEEQKLYVNKQDIKNIGQDVRTHIKVINTDIEQAIEYSTFIRVQLDKQIQNLDRVYDINKDTSSRINRATNGLRTMLRRIMMSKMTRFLSILTVIAVVGLIAVWILRSVGVL